MTLSSHHRDTVAKILDHPASGNVEWRQVLSGYAADPAVEDGRDRNHGDSRWGKPE